MNDPASTRRVVRSTPTRVRIADQIIGTVIRIGGIGIIVAVLGILIFLTLSAVPLFQGARINKDTGIKAPSAALSQGGIVALRTDDHRGAFMVIRADGEVVTSLLETGQVIDKRRLIPEGATPTAWSVSRASGAVAVGLDDGTVVFGQIGFAVEELSKEQAGQEGAEVPIGMIRPVPGGYLAHPADERFRRVTIEAELSDPTPLSAGSGPVRALHYQVTAITTYLLTVRDDGTAQLNQVRTTRPLGGGKPRIRLTTQPIPLVAPEGKSLPDWVYTTSDGAHVIALWKDGTAQRYAVRTDEAGGIALAETVSLTPAGESVQSATLLLGGKTVVLGTSKGRVLGSFVARDPGSTTLDRRRLVVAHEFNVGKGAPIVAMGIALRDRNLVAADARAGVHIRNMTSGKAVADLKAEGNIVAVDLAPKGDGLIALADDGSLRSWEIDARHPEASFKSLFGKVWYEGEDRPGYSYQSSAGDDAIEVKYSLMPLVFGTTKATVYAMLFALPLAVLAAIYTSEVLHPKVRNTVKPVIETMASLPSVVLGFIAALVVAPIARDILPSILLAFFAVPVGVLLAAHLWQMLPIRLRSRTRSWQHFVLVGLILIASLGASGLLGRTFERLLFTPSGPEVLVLAGSFEPVPPESVPGWIGARETLTHGEQRRLQRSGLFFREGQVVRPVGSLDDPRLAEIIERERLNSPSLIQWLNGVFGSAWPGWFMLMTPPGMALAVLLMGRLPGLGGLSTAGPGRAAAAASLIRLLVTMVLALAFGSALALILTSIGMDPRDSVFGPFNQRNSLVVGIIMGFAVIPIIYTISEDALSSVPGSLRSASLGCGATPWQTATRVVLPAALSGVFSAAMIGLGRAAGETMIVLMATGNTPEMDWNMFSGFRTLAANIAVELPEAPQNSTHYRVLFLCGLLLFVMTAVVNTLAEILRQRVRRRNKGL